MTPQQPSDDRARVLMPGTMEDFLMIPLSHTLAAMIRRVGKHFRGLAQYISWSNFDEDSVMWASTFRSPTGH